MAEDRIHARLFVAHDLPAESVGLGAPQAHYLLHVLRLSRGDRIALFNGRDGEWAARIEGFGRGWGTLALEGQLRPQDAAPDLWLCFAPIKRARLDFLIEKATELGVAKLWPIMTRHTGVDRVNLDRLRATAVEAAEQSERLTLPAVDPPVTLDALIAAWPAGRRLLHCDESGGGRPIAEALAGEATAGPWAILTGPEGGFARAELDALRRLPFVTPVGLGPRVLRADTAALAAIAVFQALSDDRSGTPPPRWPARE